MSDLLDFIPLFRESVDTIRARLDADVNAGVDPADGAFIDTTEGGFYWDMTQPAVLEADRLYDVLGTEVASVMFPHFAFGTYLDEHGEVLNVPRKDAVAATGTVTFTGTNGTVIGTGAQVSAPATSPDADPIIFTTTSSGTVASGTLDLTIAAVDTGAQGNVAAGTLTGVISPLPGIASVTNAAATSGGTDVETDVAYRARLLLEYSAAQGPGTITDYQRWALAYPGVSYTTIEPLWSGAGTVRVIITDAAHNPSSGATITGLQNQLDPVAGQGRGLAPVGATVTVATVTTNTVTVSATVTHLTGYTLTGAGGTIATSAAIQAAIKSYIDNLNPGETVVKERVASMFFRVTGVFDVSSLLLNGAGTNVTSTTTQVPRTGTITLS